MKEYKFMNLLDAGEYFLNEVVFICKRPQTSFKKPKTELRIVYPLSQDQGERIVKILREDMNEMKPFDKETNEWENE